MSVHFHKNISSCSYSLQSACSSLFLSIFTWCTLLELQSLLFFILDIFFATCSHFLHSYMSQVFRCKFRVSKSFEGKSQSPHSKSGPWAFPLWVYKVHAFVPLKSHSMQFIVLFSMQFIVLFSMQFIVLFSLSYVNAVIWHIWWNMTYDSRDRCHMEFIT